ncbi:MULTISPECIES: peptidoglycan DD-metalloendopeptidase family protein [unclassified Burkholderia]|uniref:peptidoglycan DD-metalloendopeptidase family protein n=1 Tax=unclassified Burkholderia TaxID=2613784 RepID=UPI000F574319|nr:MULTISPECIES: peptidoglycan DD-metalloendopeptidase family protein [unclassified Burkholderia]RQR43376.1 LysM peptidoglycan-binding domain-containing protein [Burkholderia sp. Bp9131]RQR74247.1 LysM peptidoglycan-binding domain-containing protein [Burkholderia sp. Bp9015]RQR80911.1 LysM peptidoglycan-binding domain-containing protein [Burkholderia sp. Bp9011]RQR88593.1 LysM peptidoglycan-binding domain-containing protein [Burkholderia sp. Bp9010]RQS01134.1 LysM peptidoglycan-binding domain-
MKQREICRKSAWLSGLAAVLVMAGCASTPSVPPSDTLAGSTSGQPAAAPAAPPAPILVAQKYVVKRGDTLSGIASANDCSVADLRTWNKLDGRGRLRMGQVLRIVRQQPLQAPGASASAQAAAPAAASNAAGAAQASASTASDRQVVKETRRHAGAVALRWPAQGKIVDAFKPGQNRGIQIAGRPGDPVRAAADGRVMYAGTGLNDYGTLIIVQHNADFLTAYAHNRKLLVKTGDIVRQGDEIAEMGDLDNSRVALLFEVRRDGKPVNPMPYLPSSQG